MVIRSLRATGGLLYFLAMERICKSHRCGHGFFFVIINTMNMARNPRQFSHSASNLPITLKVFFINVFLSVYLFSLFPFSNQSSGGFVGTELKTSQRIPLSNFDESLP